MFQHASTWTLIALAYAAAVSVYVAYSMTTEMGGTPDSLMNYLAMSTFGWLLLSGIGFAAMVAALDLLVGRPQQMVAALALGLIIAATYQAAIQVAFNYTHAHWKQSKPLTQNERNTSPTGEKH